MESEKIPFIVDNQLPGTVGLEIYYWQGDEIKCDCRCLAMIPELEENIRMDPVEYDVYQIVLFYSGRFHYVYRELLDKKVKSIEFPFLSIDLDHSKSVSLITLYTQG